MHLVAASGLMIDPRDLGRTLGDRNPEQGGRLGSQSGTGFDPTIFLYDAVPGGIGLSPRLFDVRESLLAKTKGLIARCPCRRGCPGCMGPEAGEMDSHGHESAPKGNRKALALALFEQLGITEAM